MRRFALLVPVALAVGGCGGAAGLFDPFKSDEARVAGTNLKQIGRAILNYHDDGRFVFPINGTTKGGSPILRKEPPLLSWRVAVLPYLEQEALYKRFNHDEPWDSEHNKKLIPLMPQIYASPAKLAPEGHTYLQQLVGPGATRHGERWVLTSITDGTSHTAVIAEAAEPVIWTKPADIEIPKEFAPGALKAKFAGQFKGGFFVLLWDGSVSVARDDADEATLKLLCCPNDGNVVNHDLWRMFAEDGKRNR
jgi:Protein of unknown function (DUF1559)